MTIMELENSLKDTNDCLDLLMEINVNALKLKSILSALGDNLHLGITHLDQISAASIVANHDINSNLFAAGCDYMGGTLDKIDELEDELKAILESLRERDVTKDPGEEVTGKTDKHILLCNAINAIEDDYLLDIIERLIYGITNPRQNGESENNKASEIIENGLK